ncbi:MAG: hypothetical protein HS116_21130 [Planctomycetes bacterium]|nr:hypothetical protein [Planctomycetota bacterium]
MPPTGPVPKHHVTLYRRGLKLDLGSTDEVAWAYHVARRLQEKGYTACMQRTYQPPAKKAS